MKLWQMAATVALIMIGQRFSSVATGLIGGMGLKK